MFGLWHAYKACIAKVHKVFLPFIAAVESDQYLQFPDVTRVYAFPDVIVKERLMLGLYLAGLQVGALRGTEVPRYYASDAGDDEDKRKREVLYFEQMKALKALCCSYAQTNTDAMFYRWR